MPSRAALFALLLPIAVYAEEPQFVNEEFIRQYAETYQFRLGRPAAGDDHAGRQRGAFSPLAATIVRLGSVRVRLPDGKRTRAARRPSRFSAGKAEELSAEEKAQRERLRLATRGIARYDLSEDGTKILVPLSGRLFVVDRATGQQPRDQIKPFAAIRSIRRSRPTAHSSPAFATAKFL